MNDLVLTLDPAKLDNPDLDLRYVISDLLSERSDGNIRDNGYDYEEQESPDSPLLAISMIASDLPSAIESVRQLLTQGEVLGNRLSSAAALYVEKDGVRSQVLFGSGLV